MLTNCHTYYSFNYGVQSPENLLKTAVKKGHSSICITDINNSSAHLSCLRLAAHHGIKAIPGIDFRNGVKQQFVALAKSAEGLEEMNRYLSRHLHEERPFPEMAPEWQHAFVIYPFESFISGKRNPGSLAPYEYIGARPWDLSRLRLSPLMKYTDKLCLLTTSTFLNQRDFNAHRLLRAIDTNTLLSMLPKSEEADPRQRFLSAAEIGHAIAEVPQLAANTKALLEQCSVKLEFKVNKNKKHFTGSAEGDIELLRDQSEAGLHYRYDNKIPTNVRERLEHELKIIVQMEFASYFLINWDLLKYARSQGFFYVGRGSGANSLVAYLLRITDVDPIELDLYFERFINPYRASPPDFDIDFSWTDRDHMTRYIFEKHGYDHTALLGTYSTYQPKAVVRELGKVFGLPAEEIDKLQRHGPGHQLGKMGDLVLKYGEYISNLPGHLSVHSSGIVISEKPIYAYGATFLPPKDFPTTQFSMLEAEDVGLYKFDILAQRGLGKIRDAVETVRENTGDILDIHDINRFKKDEKIKTVLREGQAIGCFYVESPAMRMLLKKLNTDDYLGLVAASSIIRPGVAKSGMMREYILRHRDPARREQAQRESPDLYRILSETYGVMVYQEDVIKVAYYFAGLTLAEADILRRGMSWKYRQRSEFHTVKDKFWRNCTEKGHAPEVIAKTWNEIESFANYAFAKGHSASYAVESYQALFLKAYYPLEYLVATINNGGGFYRVELYVHEARMHGADVQAPCINRSGIETRIDGKTIYLGFSLVRELEQETMRKSTNERERNGAYHSLSDFLERTGISFDQAALLARTGAFRFTGKTKKELLWEGHMAGGGRQEFQTKMFGPPAKKFKLPTLHTAPLEDAFDQIELLGFPLQDPFSLVMEDTSHGLPAEALQEQKDRQVVAYGYLVALKETRTAKGDKMHFGTFLDRNGHFIDTVHFPPVAVKYPFQGRGIYKLQGKVTEEFGFCTLDVGQMERLRTIEDPRFSEAKK